MKNAMRAGGLSCGVVAMMMVGSYIFAQDTKPETKAPDVRKEAKPATYRLPNNFARLSLTDDQKKKIKSVQATYAQKIDELEAQLLAIRDKQQAEIDGVLTPEQMTLLTSIRAESKQKQEAAKAAREKQAQKRTEKAEADKKAEAQKKQDAEKKPETEKKTAVEKK